MEQVALGEYWIYTRWHVLTWWVICLSVIQTCSLVLYSAHAGNNVYEIKQRPYAAVRLRTAQANAGPVQVYAIRTNTILTLIISCYSTVSWYTLCLQKVHPFYFRDNFSNFKPIQITFGRNIAEKIWNKLTHGNFDIGVLLCVDSLYRKWHQFFSQFHNVKIQYRIPESFCDDDTVREVVFFSLWITSVINF